MLVDRLGISERRACKIAGQHRSSQRYEPVTARDDAALRAALRAVPKAKHQARFGHRRAHAVLVADGWNVNRKRVQRLWREEGLRVPARKRQRQRTGESTAPDGRLVAQRPGHLWSIDFLSDSTTDGRQLRVLNVVDEFTRQAVVVHAARSITADDLVAHLEAATRQYGVPELVRMDNGTELTAHALRDWCRFAHVTTKYIDPGAPWQNSYVESFNSRLRDELLDLEQFTCLAEARVLLAD